MVEYVNKDNLQEFATKMHNKQKTIFSVDSEVKDRFFSLNNSDSILLSSGDDLNDKTTPGNYYVTNSTLANSLLNCPITGTGFTLKVLQTSASGRVCQIIIPNTSVSAMYIRTFVGAAWSSWAKLLTDIETIKCTSIAVKSNNYTTYFPNGSFNDAPMNTIMYLSNNVPLTDGPDGDSWIGYGSHSSTGYISGTLMTFRAFATNASNYATVQLLFGYRNTDYSPTFSYRCAIVDSNGLNWSNWSKFEQNGYLRAGNRVISAGRMSESVSDLDNMEQNAIYQIDKNCNGATTDSTLGHHPFPGVSCVVVNMAFSYSTPHGQVQTVYALDGRVAWRYGYQNDVNDYRWTAWKQYATNIPDAPTTDGTYTLQCTVSSGTPTYSWVSST